MCTRTVITRNMLGNREQSFSLWNGTEMIELTRKEIIAAIRKGDVIQGFDINKDADDLVLDEKFFTTNLMEHRQCNNYKPMIEDDNIIANKFYIVLGQCSNGDYEVITTRFQKTTLSEDKLKIMFGMGLVSAGAKVVNDKVVLPEIEGEFKPEDKKPEDKKPEPKPEDMKAGARNTATDKNNDKKSKVVDKK